MAAEAKLEKGGPRQGWAVQAEAGRRPVPGVRAPLACRQERRDEQPRHPSRAWHGRPCSLWSVFLEPALGLGSVLLTF